VRGLADAIGADQAMRTVRSARVARGEPRALTHDEYARLLRMPDGRTRHGKRELALLHLLGSAGLRRAEAATSPSATSTSAAAPPIPGCARRSRARPAGG
jgi:site-specific recombinase XerD